MRLPGHRLMLFAAAVSLMVLLAVAVVGVPTAARVHLLLAVAVAPLIFCAIIYFTPVLTRGPAPGLVILWIPVAVFAAGAAAVWGLGRGPAALVAGAAVVALSATLALGHWVWMRGRTAFLGAHPGLRWYLLALAAFALGLLAILGAQWWPRAWVPLRALHLHLNLVGFVGLTAVGTLNVLLPTAGRYRDSAAAARLRRHWPWAAAGSGLIAVAALGAPLLGVLGTVLWLYPVGVFASGALRQRAVRHWHGAALSLTAALLGWGAVLLAGIAHGLGWWPGQQVLWLAAFGFLLPLITGAIAVLLPVWMDPANVRCREPAERILSRHTGVRVIAFLVASVAIVLADHGLARAAAAGGMVAFALAVVVSAVRCTRRRRSR